MTNDEVLAMAPGAELNAKIAEKVMGNLTTHDEFFGPMERLIDPTDGSSVWIPLRPFSEDMAAAESVVEGMLELGYSDAIYWSKFGEGAYSEAEAICKAALLAIAEGPVTCQTH